MASPTEAFFRKRKALSIKDHVLVSHELSELISVKEFKEKVSAIYRQQNEEKLVGANPKDIQELIGADDGTFKACVEKCNVQGLLPPGGLIAVQHRNRKDLPRDTGLESIDNVFNIDLVTIARRILHPAPIDGLPVNFSNCVNCPEVVLSLCVYHPIKMSPFAQYKVLASQRLTELRDKLYCPRDYTVEQDYSEMPDIFDRSMPLFPSRSGYFFINDTFYNDMRDMTAIDYSIPIMKWSQEPIRLANSPRINKFQSVNMSTVTFQDLHIRLGYPYLYCHHGNCEHPIIFTDMRLFSHIDVPNPDVYPLLSDFFKDVRKKCVVCEEFTATWVTIDDELASESPSYFCHSCFKMLHYDKDNNKLCEFKAYPYFDETTTLIESQIKR
jgi:snRNA-activating protein complex subunit 3